MNRRKFINELKRRLAKLPPDEVKEAIDYYERYFDDAGIENEQTVLAGLGSPAEVASQIIADFAVKKTPAKRGLSVAWIIILAVFASPIALPLALTVAVMAVVFIAVILVIIISVGLTGFAVLIAGIICAVSGVIIIVKSLSSFLLYLGLGLVFCGIGIAVIILAGLLSQKCFSWLAKSLGKFVIGRGSA